jgi:D-alanyl-D-alanine carboxypeptidase
MRKKRWRLGVRFGGLVVVVLALGAIGGGWYVVTSGDHIEDLAASAAPGLQDPAATDPSRSSERTGAAPQTHAFDRAAHSRTDPSSIWVIVNKSHPITPSDFRPELRIVRGYQVAVPAAAALSRMLDDSDRQGLGFKIASAFRSYGYQAGVHAQLAARQGDRAADQVSARAGYSEHQTGLAVDLITPTSPSCDFEQCFAGTSGGQWLAANAWRYGFVVRYTEANEPTTGYSPEPWHLRYVGRDLAAELRRTATGSLEEFFGVTGGDYP